MSTIPHARVLASAGTGKTHRLTNRYLQLLLDGVDPRTILATTFTRAAAAEILQRIMVRTAHSVLDEDRRAALALELGARELPADRLSNALSAMLARLPELQVCTIDSFVYRLISVGSRELGFGIPPEVIYSDQDGGLQGRILRRVFDQLDSDSEFNAFAESIEGLSKAKPGQSIIGTIEGIVSSGLPLFHQSHGDPARWSWPVDPGLERIDLRPIIEGLASVREGRSKAIVGDLERLVDLLEALPEGEPRFERLRQALGRGLPLKVRDGSPTYGTGKQNLIDGAVQGQIERLNRYFDQLVVREYGRRTISTFDLLRRYHQAREEVRREEGVAGFDDLVRALVEADPDLLRDELWIRLDAQVDHLLLDEFQDTSLFQWRALRPLAEEIVSDGTGERSFFAVGDVKQSIYSWRGGLPGILEHLPTMILPDGIPASLVDETLSLSWRTGPEILEVLNHLFSGLSGTSFPGLGEHFAMAASRFDRLWDPHRSAPSTTPGCFELIEAPEDSPSSNAAQRLEATTAATADLAEELHRRHPGLSIGILAPKNRIAADLVARLRRRGLDATGEGGGSFMDCGASIVFLDALRFAAHPGDSAAGFNLRHSPLGELLASDHPDSDQSGMARHLRLAFSNAGVSRTFESWCSRLGGILDRREIGRLERLVVETNRLEIGGLVDPLDLLQQLESLRLDEPGSDAIRVMTVHGSKGLAFDLVILTGLDGNLVRPAELVQERDPSTQELLRVARWVTKQLLPPEILPLQRSTQADMVFERLCQLYVSMTRARRGLFAVVARSGSNSSAPARLLREALLPRFAAADPDRPELLARSGGRSCLPERRGDRPEPPDTPARVPVLRGGMGPIRAAPPSAAAGASGTGADPHGRSRRFGTAVHRLLERVEFTEQLPPAVELEAAVSDLLPDDDERTEVLEAFSRMLEQPAVRSVLSREALLSAAEPGTQLRVHRELPWIRLLESGRMQGGSVDRVVVFERDGRPVRALVVDWKTHDLEGSEADAVAGAHHAQLSAYRETVSGLEGLPGTSVEACVVFPVSGIRVPVEL